MTPYLNQERSSRRPGRPRSWCGYYDMVEIHPGRSYGLNPRFWPKNGVVILAGQKNFVRWSVQGKISKCENEQRQQGKKGKPTITANVRTAIRRRSKSIRKFCAKSATVFLLSGGRADVTSEGWEFWKSSMIEYLSLKISLYKLTRKKMSAVGGFGNDFNEKTIRKITERALSR